jgi:hypothetical protein
MQRLFYLKFFIIVFNQTFNAYASSKIIIKSTNGNVFGGYTEQSWSGIGFKADSSSFIFSFNQFQVSEIDSISNKP